MSLKQRVARSSMWSAAQVIGNQLTSFVVFIVLTRLLNPAEIGVVALAASFIDITAPLVRAGFPEALVQRRELKDIHSDTCFWTSIGFSIVACLAMIALAPVFANGFGMPELSIVLQILALDLPLSALSATHEALMTRSFGFKSLALRSLIAVAAGGVVGIVMAVNGYGVWSLVAQRLVTTIVSIVIVWLGYRWIPKLRFSVDTFRSMGQMGMYMMGTSFLTTLSARVSDFVLGFMLGAQSVGFVRVANRSITSVYQLTLSPFTTLALPTFSRLQDDRPALERAFARMLQVSGIIALPAYFGLAVVAVDMVPLVFGPQWTTSAPLLALLCLNGVSNLIQYFTWPALAAVGRSEKATLGVFISVLSSIILTAAAAPFGLVAVVAANVVRNYLVLPLSLWMLKRYAGVRPMSQFRAIAKPLLLSLVMAACVFVLRYNLMDLELGLRVGILTVAGGLIYVALMLVFSRDLIKEILSLRTR